nr:elongation factor 1 delta [Hymenolepis microstoma]
MQVLKMGGSSLFDAAHYAKFPNYPQMELDYMHFLSKSMESHPAGSQSENSFVVKAIQKIVADIDKSLDTGDQWNSRVKSLEDLVRQMSLRIDELEGQVKRLGHIFSSELPKNAKPVQKPAAIVSKKPSPAPKKEEEEADDDFDLFGDDDEEDLKSKHVPVVAKPVKKAAPIAKSLIVLDVKPWDDTTNMEELEAKVREISTDGLTWGTGKLVPLAYGIKKLQIACVVEDDKVGSDFLEENITAIEDYVQSVDIASFNKL